MLTDRIRLYRAPLPSWPVVAVVAAAVTLYLFLAPWHSLDADHWFVPWLDQMVRQGPWQALGQPMQVETDGAAGFANYNPPYLYLLALASLLSPVLGSLAIVKLVAAAGAVLCAACVFALTRQFMPIRQAALASAGVLLLPTVALNAAGWGQTDAIYAGLLVLAVAGATAGNWVLLMLAFGSALAFKLPAIFLGPFVLYVVISRRVPLWTLLLAPLAYLVSLLPALLAGQSLHTLVHVYADQAETYHWLSMKAPNPWSVIQYLTLVDYDDGVIIGTVGAAVGGLGLALLALRWRLAGRDLLLLATTCAVLMPFLLPKMHDRYFFPADVLSYACAVVAPGRRSAATAAAVQVGSLAAYSSILFGLRAGPVLGAAAMTVAVVFIALQLAHALRQGRLFKGTSFGSKLIIKHHS